MTRAKEHSSCRLKGYRREFACIDEAIVLTVTLVLQVQRLVVCKMSFVSLSEISSRVAVHVCAYLKEPYGTALQVHIEQYHLTSKYYTVVCHELDKSHGANTD